MPLVTLTVRKGQSPELKTAVLDAAQLRHERHAPRVGRIGPGATRRHLFGRSDVEVDDGGGRSSRTDGQNPPTGAVIRFHLKEAPAKDAKSRLEILDANGAVVREYKSDADSPGAKLDVKAGMNRVVWDLRHADAESFPGLVIWGSLTGPRCRTTSSPLAPSAPASLP